MKERPTRVTVFSVINIIFCCLGIMGAIFWLLSKLRGAPTEPTGNAIADAITTNKVLALFTDVTSGLGILITILVLAAAIGMLQLKPWARLATIGWGVYSIVISLTSIVLHYVLVFHRFIQSSAGEERIGAIVGFAFMVIFITIFISYWAVMIQMLRASVVVQAFNDEPFDEELEVAESPMQAAGGDI